MERMSFIADIRNGKYDKTVHFSASFVLTALLTSVAALHWSALIVFFIGVLKEVVDSTRTGDHFDLGDLATDCAGIAAASLLIIYLR